jgi:hypothetical protein
VLWCGAGGRDVELPGDDLGELPERDAVLGDRVQSRSGRGVFDRQPVQPGGVERVHGRPARSPRSRCRPAAAGLRVASDTLFEQHREDAVKLGRVIGDSPELQERELVKRAALTATIAAALRDRATTDPAAVVTAWSSVEVFYVARNR